jgi:hypothetical protein
VRTMEAAGPASELKQSFVSTSCGISNGKLSSAVERCVMSFLLQEELCELHAASKALASAVDQCLQLTSSLSIDLNHLGRLATRNPPWARLGLQHCRGLRSFCLVGRTNG